MSQNHNADLDFDLQLASECAAAFSGATGIGCVVSRASGSVLRDFGYSCSCCQMCRYGNLKKENCVKSHIYGMTEAERFGGKYIYFCPMGLTCFVSPIMGDEGSAAKITAGPFLMVDRQDYIACDLTERLQIPEDCMASITEELEKIPVVDPSQVNKMSTLLFMAVGFMNNVSAANRMLNTQNSDAIQGQITAYIMQLKSQNGPPPYPFETERALLNAIAQSNKSEAGRLLNELFSYIFFVAGADFDCAKTRIYELLVLISRTAIDAGADPDGTLRLSRTYLHELWVIKEFDELCFWLTKVMNMYMDSVFNYKDVKHADIIHKTMQYMRTHYAEKITLEQMAGKVYLSTAYFSRIFNEEMGCSFNNYLNTIRIEKSKEMLLLPHMRMTDIALLVGFEDQSYFTKVFKRVTGMSPLDYRKTKGGLHTR